MTRVGAVSARHNWVNGMREMHEPPLSRSRDQTRDLGGASWGETAIPLGRISVQLMAAMSVIGRTVIDTLSIGGAIMLTHKTPTAQFGLALLQGISLSPFEWSIDDIFIVESTVPQGACADTFVETFANATTASTIKNLRTTRLAIPKTYHIVD